MKGSIYYYYENPKNPVNDWFVKEHYKRFNEPPDFFTCGGFAAASAVVEAITKAGSTDTEKLIATMEGMVFMTPKGTMMFRKEDHQALQSMFAFKLDVKPDVEWAIPVLIERCRLEETAPPIHEKIDVQLTIEVVSRKLERIGSRDSNGSSFLVRNQQWRFKLIIKFIVILHPHR